MDQVAGIIWDVAKCLCGRANEEAAYINDLEENLKSLKDKWEELQRKREDLHRKVDEAENSREMQRTQEVDGWMKKVDAFQKEVEDIQVKGDQEVQNKCLSKCCPKNCMSSYKLGKNTVKMLERVSELITKGEKFVSKDVEIAHKLPPRPMEMPLDETVGLDLMFDKVWNSIEEENVGVIGLYGMGGVGKTTLLKKINNELGKKWSNFDVVIWVVASKDPNLDGIMDNIRKLIGVGDEFWNHCSIREQKVAKIHEVLKGKKFVLLLDDIWQILELNKVGVPHPKVTGFRSKVLFTTRSEDVCAKMQAQRTFKVEILTEKEALKLFCMKVGEETLKVHPDIPKLAEEMAVECKGLPLALTIVGRAMAGVKSVEVWKYSRNHLMTSSQTSSDWEEVFSILKFSYDRLPNGTHRKCFLYCALYPEDYQINVLDLIDMWMWEGFLDENATESIQDIYGHGESVIAKLKQSCLLESVEDDLFMSRTVKLHDVIRDMALWVARDQDKNKKKILVEGDALVVSQDDVETWKIVERISIMQNGELHFPAVPCPNLITLRLSKEESWTIEDFLNIQYMSRLKVLDLSFGRNSIMLVPEIGGLVFLENLSLTGQMWTSEFLIELKNLKNLKFFTLDIHGRSPSFIPLEVISGLKQLRMFRFIVNQIDIDKIGEEREFLEKLESLLKLEVLWIQITTENGLNKLLESTKLQSCMYNLTLDGIDTQINMSSLLASMSRMKHLHEIWFVNLNNIVEESSFWETCYLSMLRKVVIRKCNSIVHLTWLKYALVLQDLEIRWCESLEEVIKGETEDRENVDNIFSSLVRLELGYLPKLRSIYKKALPFLSLKIVEIDDCPNLKKLPFDSNTAAEKLKEIKGKEEWWNELEWEDPDIKHKFHSIFQPY